MSNDDNVIPFPTDQESYEPTEADWEEASRAFFLQQDPQQIAVTVALVLELLTAKAMDSGSYYFLSETGEAMTLITIKEDVETIRNMLPEHIKNWDEITSSDMEVVPFLTDTDPGDEQDEPTA